MYRLEHLSIHRRKRAVSELKPSSPWGASAVRWQLSWSPAAFLQNELETSLTLMGLLIHSHRQGVLLHPVLVLTNYQACLTGEGCFNLALWGLSLGDLRSTLPCVISASLQGGLILCGWAGASLRLVFQAVVPSWEPRRLWTGCLSFVNLEEPFCYVDRFAVWDILALFSSSSFWWLKMADQARQKRTGKYFSFSGASRKDSVKALRLSRSLNLKRATRVSKRQVGTELCDPFKLPWELKNLLLCVYLIFFGEKSFLINLKTSFQSLTDVCCAPRFCVDVCMSPVCLIFLTKCQGCISQVTMLPEDSNFSWVIP